MAGTVEAVQGKPFIINATAPSFRRNILFRTINRLLSGLSDTAKAFIIIAVTDILLGYHSEEGWTATIRLIAMHYGWELDVS